MPSCRAAGRRNACRTHRLRDGGHRFACRLSQLVEGPPGIGKATLREAAFRHRGAHAVLVAVSAAGAGPGLNCDALAAEVADEIAMRRR